MSRFASPLAATFGALSLSLLAGCAAPVTRTTRVYDAPGYEAPVSRVQYGTVRRIEVEETTQHAGGGGAVLGGLVGGVLGNQVGRGSGNAVATALGVFGGAVAGNQIERDQAAAHSGTVYHVFVEFDNGHRRSFAYRDLNGLHAGDRVRYQGGVLDRA